MLKLKCSGVAILTQRVEASSNVGVVILKRLKC